MRHRLMPTQCGVRALGHLSLVFGLLASGALSLAVATDFWLFTTELLDPADLLAAASAGNDVGGGNSSMSLSASDYTQGQLAPQDNFSLGDGPVIPVVAKLHSGLWRSCFYFDEQDIGEEIAHPASCNNIVYFGQDSGRHDGADTTNSILRAIRKSSPVIVGSLFIMVTALACSIIGNNKRDSRTLVAAILYVCSALSLAVGVIFYISAVNDEVSHRKKSITSSEPAGFTYHYGWAFFFAGSSFMCAMVAAVNNISLYLRRGFQRDEDEAGATRFDDRDDVKPDRHRLHHVNITTPV